MYKNMFSMCMKEKFGSIYFVYYILLGIITICIDEMLSYGILFTLVLFTAIQVSRMFSFQAINCINSGYTFFRVHKAKNILVVALLANLPWLFFMIVKTLITDSTILCPIILIWGYSTILGTIAGIYVKNEVINYGLMLLCFFFCIQKMLIHELYFRYISPVIVFKGEVNLYNILGICILSAFGIVILLMLKRKNKLLLLLIMSICFFVLTLCEMKYEKIIESKEFIFVNKEGYTIEYNSKLSEENVEHISEVISKIEICLNEYGFDIKTTNYHMNFTIYFPWESNQQKVFIRNRNGICNINFYTESLCKISDEELITRYIYSTLEQNTQLQEIAVELLIDDVISQVIFNERSSHIINLSYDSLVENYGYCISPKQCIIVECMKLDPNSFEALYYAFASAQNLKEVKIETLGVNSEYEKVYRRIVE